MPNEPSLVASCPGTNPELLFAVGRLACFLSAIKIVAARMKAKLPAGLAVEAEVGLGTAGGGYLQARPNVNLPGIDRLANRLTFALHHRTLLGASIETKVSAITSSN